MIIYGIIKADNDGGWGWEIEKIFRSKKKADDYIKSKSRIRNYDYYIQDFELE